ncbi:MAG: hypothetical protein IPJ14_15135 [Kineosporiaceae bacterium]|nr:hypothetical protein [Kineosporiaceae bacterium]
MFAVLEFNDPLCEEVYKCVIVPAVHDAGLQARRGDDGVGGRGVVDEIYEHIRGAAAVIGDLTRNNPNVYYEVGWADAHHPGGVILIYGGPDVEALPFDVRHRRIRRYRGAERQQLHATLVSDITKSRSTG